MLTHAGDSVAKLDVPQRGKLLIAQSIGRRLSTGLRCSRVLPPGGFHAIRQANVRDRAKPAGTAVLHRDTEQLMHHRWVGNARHHLHALCLFNTEQVAPMLTKPMDIGITEQQIAPLEGGVFLKMRQQRIIAACERNQTG
ncbi:hypothetical protein D3C72_1714100 [compost metagenome]